MSFQEVQFPTDISYNSSGGPGFKTTILRMANGTERRIQRWSQRLGRYSVNYGVKSVEDLYTVLAFYHSMRGSAYGFRYKDFLDCTSSPITGWDTSLGGAPPTSSDQQVTLADNGVDYQLCKRYNVGTAWEFVRKISKPVLGTVVLSQAGSVDYETGIVTGVSGSCTAGFEFDVPVRFDESADEALRATIEFFDGGAVQNIELVEIRL